MRFGYVSAAIHHPPSQAIDFDDFFLQHHQRLIACALALTGNREQSRDAAQETMSRAYRNWAHVSSMEHPAAWLRTDLLHLITDEGRRSTRQQIALPRLWSDPAAPQPDLPTDLLDAIRSLPERQRHAIVLHYLDDLSVAEVAKAMDIAEGTVKATLHQARATLATALHEENR